MENLYHNQNVNTYFVVVVLKSYLKLLKNFFLETRTNKMNTVQIINILTKTSFIKLLTFITSFIEVI